MIKVAPSILAADILNLGAEIEDVLNCGADWLHLDIMDGHFVPNLSFGPSVVSAISKRFPNAYRDVHLMLDEPEKYTEAFIQAGANAITIHAEINGAKSLIRKMKECGQVKTGLSLKPGTPVSILADELDLLDIVLIMTVEPGFGGQKFMRPCADKIMQLRQMGYQGIISVDGGVNMENAGLLKSLGADVLVLGTAVFKASNRAETIEKLHKME